MKEGEKRSLVIEIDGKVLPINPFVRKIIRESVLAMIRTLKGTEIKGDEFVQIEIRSEKPQQHS